VNELLRPQEVLVEQKWGGGGWRARSLDHEDCVCARDTVERGGRRGQQGEGIFAGQHVLVEHKEMRIPRHLHRELMPCKHALHADSRREFVTRLLEQTPRAARSFRHEQHYRNAYQHRPLVEEEPRPTRVPECCISA
jgi:hypothetical protein